MSDYRLYPLQTTWSGTHTDDKDVGERGGSPDYSCNSSHFSVNCGRCCLLFKRLESSHSQLAGSKQIPLISP